MTTSHDRAVLNQILNPLMPFSEGSANEDKLEDDKVDHENYEESKNLEKEGVKLAESGKLDEAIITFTKAIEICDVNPSAYNNRAQAYRLQERPDDALNDLNAAIRLSSTNTKASCNAHLQRASIYRLKREDEKAREDFQKAADMGSSFAKMQLVSLNPYAAMCNKMLAEVFDNLKEGK